ncbi:hypothetical protein G9A89_007893 [Geosiphon pyriformis]|nr:hypothetical protein G9A89_007893 [Geosiphon pyriformis]
MLQKLFITCVLFSFVISIFIEASTDGPGDPGYGYTAYNGPETEAWGSFCKNGTTQSPINIDSKLFSKGTGTPSIIDTKAIPNSYPLKMTNKVLQVEYTAIKEKTFIPISLFKDNLTYQLHSFHYHVPSEHRIGNIHYDAEIHFVFKTSFDPDAKLAVVGYFLEVNSYSKDYLLALFSNGIPHANDSLLVEALRINGFFQESNGVKDAYQYDGSLTTPPCSQGVKWHVNPIPYQISYNNLIYLRNATGYNSRPVQKRTDGAGEFNDKKI